MKTSPASEPLVRLSCRIDPADIEAMLDAYDSGMCDISTANCITRAIAKQLTGDRRVRLLRLGENRLEVEVWGQRLPLCAELKQWLRTAETGGKVEPVDFVLHIAGPHQPDREAGPRHSHAAMVR
jgi:hypothetical protein